MVRAPKSPAVWGRETVPSGLTSPSVRAVVFPYTRSDCWMVSLSEDRSPPLDISLRSGARLLVMELSLAGTPLYWF